MDITAAAFPSLDKVDSALRRITEILARQVSAPSETPPIWNDFEWRIAHAVASMQGISSQLCCGLVWQHAPWRGFLEDQRTQIAQRHLRIEQLLDMIDRQARQDGIALVALKGAALHTMGFYQPGDRPMADIDLLAQPADAEAVTKLLERCGYTNTFSSWRDQLFEPRIRSSSAAFGEHAGNPVKIELHTRICERLPVREIEITALLFPREALPGINKYESTAFLMMHLLLHAAGNMRARALRMIQLHDIAKLAATFGSDDWEKLLAARPSGQALWWAAPPLMLTANYYASAIPSFVLARLRTECPPRLRKITQSQLLADVSWSNIRVHALPGIEWARSPREAGVFVFRRVLPSREARLELKRFSTYHTGGSEIPWYGLSQVSRIFRWVFSRPPRVQTVLSVRAALSRPDDYLDNRVTADSHTVPPPVC